jgi:hypothetical protein
MASLSRNQNFLKEIYSSNRLAKTIGRDDSASDSQNACRYGKKQKGVLSDAFCFHYKQAIINAGKLLASMSLPQE